MYKKKQIPDKGLPCVIHKELLQITNKETKHISMRMGNKLEEIITKESIRMANRP